MADEATVRARLERASADFWEKDAAREKARKELVAAVRAAHGTLPQGVIASLARWSRERIRQLTR